MNVGTTKRLRNKEIGANMSLGFQVGGGLSQSLKSLRPFLITVSRCRDRFTYISHSTCTGPFPIYPQDLTRHWAVGCAWVRAHRYIRRHLGSGIFVPPQPPTKNWCLWSIVIDRPIFSQDSEFPRQVREE